MFRKRICSSASRRSEMSSTTPTTPRKVPFREVMGRNWAFRKEVLPPVREVYCPS